MLLWRYWEVLLRYVICSCAIFNPFTTTCHPWSLVCLTLKGRESSLLLFWYRYVVFVIRSTHIYLFFLFISYLSSNISNRRNSSNNCCTQLHNNLTSTSLLLHYSSQQLHLHFCTASPHTLHLHFTVATLNFTSLVFDSCFTAIHNDTSHVFHYCFPNFCNNFTCSSLLLHLHFTVSSQ